VELLVITAILLIVISATLTFFSDLTKRSYQEGAKTRTTQTGIVFESILLKDIAMAGFGVPTIVHISGTDHFVPIWSNNNSGQNNSDELIIKGAVISSATDNCMKWGYNTAYINATDTSITISSTQETSPSPTYPSFSQFEPNDKIIFLDAETKALLGDIYTVQSVSGNTITLDKASGFVADRKNILAFSLGGISKTDSGANINTFQDYLLNTFTGYRLCSCVSNLCSLCRVYGSSLPVLDGVLDFQVQFGLIDVGGNVTWKDDISAESPTILKNQLKLVRIFIVKQYGRKDVSYTYPSTSISTANNTINLNSELRHYRWRTITLEIPLREL